MKLLLTVEADEALLSTWNLLFFYNSSYTLLIPQHFIYLYSFI